MEKKPKVSVIIPVYNVEPYLAECVESIRNQTERELEIILVDDGSTDACPHICDQFAAEDARIRVFHQENKGVSSARNAGIEMAAADWLIFVDSDDWLEQNAVEILYRQAVEENCDIVCATFISHTLAGHVLNERSFASSVLYFKNQDRRFFFESILVGSQQSRPVNLQSACAKIYSRKLFNMTDGCRFPEGLKRREDLIFNLYAVYNARSVVALNIPLYHCRARYGSACHTLFPDTQERYDRYNEEVYIFLKKHGLWEEYHGYYNLSLICVLLEMFKLYATGICGLKDFYAARSQLKALAHKKEYRNAIIDTKLSDIHSYKWRVMLGLLKWHLYTGYIFLCVCWEKLLSDN